MGRFFIFLGILLTIVSVTYMIGMLMGPNIPALQPYVEMLICNPNETLETRTISNFSSDSGSSMIFECIGLEGETRDAMVSALIWIGGGFSALTIASIICFFIGAGIIAKNVTQNYTSRFTELASAQGTFTVQPGAATVIDLRGKQDNDSLSDKLKNLKEAYDQGLISEQEYQQVRQAILDRMDD